MIAAGEHAPEPSALVALRRWPVRRFGVALVAAAATALAIGIPTDLVPNPVFARSTPVVRAWDYPLLVATSIVAGLLVATWSSGSCPLPTGERRLVSGGVLGFLAVGCPTCNHLVVLALGSAGALAWFQPVQPLLGVAGLAVMGVTLRRRLRAGG